MKIIGDDITVMVGNATLLRNVSVVAEPGALVGLIGPNGAGKSTLLRVLAGLRKCTRGHVHYDSRSLAKLSRPQLSQRLAYLAQRGPVAWPLTVERLVALGRVPHQMGWGRPDTRAASAIATALAETDMSQLSDRVVDTLSGGELARALLARALAVDGEALLADEPVAELDPYHQLQVMQILRARADSGQTVVVVLHEITLAARFCDRLVLLDRGRVVAAGAASEVLTDENLHATYRVRALRGEHDALHYVLPWERLD